MSIETLAIETLADVPGFAGRPSRKVAPQRKAVSWIVAGIIQLLMISLLTFSQYQEALLRRGSSLETVIALKSINESLRPDVQMAAPPSDSTVITPPVVLMPPPPQFQMERPREDEGTAEGDLLGAIGRDVACSANNYENLNAAQRARCLRAPWQGMKLPNGMIVLAPQRANRFAPPPEPYRMTGAEADRRAIETTPVCPPSATNIPCLNVVPGRN